jgi:hypothetical protein
MTGAVTPSCDTRHVPTTTRVDQTAARLATILTGSGGPTADAAREASHSDLVFESTTVLRPLGRAASPPADVWAVDGGQAVVADARCLQVVVTRAARVRWRPWGCELEDEGDLHVHLVGCGEEREAVGSRGLPVTPDSAVDINLLRDWGEWEAVGRCVDEADPGALVLIDGDLQPDWRIPSSFLDGLLTRAAARGVTLAGVTKHSSLHRAGAPLLGVLEREAESLLGPRAMWWTRIAGTRSDVSAGLQVLAARLDPDARFSFRVDLPADADAETVLGGLSTVCDDAAFPGYPYPLSVADRLAACPGWIRDEVWSELEDRFDHLGVPADVRERAFADRHRLMERA